ncbi:response regulator [Undibacterium cyanobacteriorum]|uniref:histidine kinase n=1 Tax=Undibacterium cyanobacteriorum TaxID=3073561 RepID=A0ABY9RFL7_9BURK|nr:response regulator [Undibacterium sp. 20NA77.5]WMW80012.1 response regulator [Undibacterium sp. 20NA77.5]
MDPRTAFILTTAFALLNGGVLGLMHRGLSRQIRPSAVDWRIGTLIAAGGVLLLAVQTPDSAWLLLPVGNTFVFMGFALYWRSVRRFDHLPDTAWIFLPTLVGAVALTWFTLVTPLLWVRVCITTVVWNTMIAGSSYSLLKHRQFKHEIGRVCLAGIFLILMCFMTGRAIYFALYLRDVQTIVSNEHFINILTPMSTAVLPVIGTTAFLMMCSERLRGELAARAIELDQKNADLKQAILAREDAERIARHDLKTPLASIAAAPALLRGNTGNQEELLQMIEGSARRALNMVNLSLDLYRMEKGQYPLHPEPTDLKAVLNTVLDDLHVHALAKHLQIKVSEHGAVRLAFAEAALCYSCIANLIKNAIEAASERSTVAIDIEYAQLITLKIHNDTAVPEELRHCFFDKYATLGKEGGSGLGTYSSRLLAQVQKGDLTMHTSEQEGTTLCLSLPVYAGSADSVNSPLPIATPLQTSIETSELSKDKLHILMVDDDLYNTKVVAHQLQRFGISLSTALNGKYGWQACLERRPDLILMDIEMPIMNGIDALQAIRSMQKIRNQTPSLIVAFSSDDGIHSHERFLKMGFDYCLSKPASASDLLALIEKLPPPSPPSQQWDEVRMPVELLPDLEAFLTSRITLINDLEKAMEMHDHANQRRISHKLSGSFAMYGFNWAAQHCKLIETQDLAHDRKQNQIDELMRHLSEVAIIEDTKPEGAPSRPAISGA